eukprot:g10625.t1
MHSGVERECRFSCNVETTQTSDLRNAGGYRRNKSSRHRDKMSKREKETPESGWVPCSHHLLSSTQSQVTNTDTAFLCVP